MSSENENINQQDASGNAGDDLASTLSGGETEFVAGPEVKKSPNQMLYLGLVVALAGAGMYFMYKRQGPETAQAANPDAAKAAQTINEFLSTGPSGIQKMQEMLKDTEKVVQQFQEYPSTNQIPLSELAVNPFQFGTAKSAAASDEDEAKKKREQEKQAVIKASAALQLQSIIHSGSRKACMINNTLYREGEQVEQFIIEKIEKGRVVVKTGAYRFELKMQK
ncbi:MAG: hypothetical protein ABIP55_01110 [Tepidisphaeraceae bacterium]